ncbi:MAG TPA: ribonuclease domain-containing protein [Lysobacter sp.]
MRRPVWIIVGLLILGLWLWSQHGARAPVQAPAGTTSQVAKPSTSPFSQQPAAETARSYPTFLPPEAHDVLERIARGGPFEYRQDGSVFQNREHRLPAQPRGYYHEYTVETPGSRDRGARRIITGGEPPREYWYTEDHYRSFQRFEVSP